MLKKPKKEEKEEVKVTATKAVKLESKVTGTDVHNPGFDPDIPEQKQRWLR